MENSPPVTFGEIAIVFAALAVGAIAGLLAL